MYDCYKCIHRREVPGSAHSSCAHPDAGVQDAMGSLAAILASVGRAPPMIDVAGAEKLDIKANPHGIAKGWFNWPHNFDPAWLDNCNGYEEKKPETDRLSEVREKGND